MKTNLLSLFFLFATSIMVAQAIEKQPFNSYNSPSLAVSNYEDFKILQNPSSSKLVIGLPALMDDMILDVFDVLGKKVMRKELNSLTSTIDVSKWNSGVYLVRITSNDITKTKRFIKQ